MNIASSTQTCRWRSLGGSSCAARWRKRGWLRVAIGARCVSVSTRVAATFCKQRGQAVLLRRFRHLRRFLRLRHLRRLLRLRHLLLKWTSRAAGMRTCIAQNATSLVASRVIMLLREGRQTLRGALRRACLTCGYFRSVSEVPQASRETPQVNREAPEANRDRFVTLAKYREKFTMLRDLFANFFLTATVYTVHVGNREI